MSARYLPLILISLATVASAEPRRPHVIPGQPIEVSAQTLRVLDAVMGHTDLLDDALRYGSRVTGVVVRQGREQARYEIGFGTCSFEPAVICRTKARLVIDRGYMIGHGPFNRAEVIPARRGDAAMPASANNEAAAIIGALAHVAPEAANLAHVGNTLSGASIQNISYEFSRYSIVMKHCMPRDGGTQCLGGGMLMIEERTVGVGPGPRRTTYTARVNLIRG